MQSTEYKIFDKIKKNKRGTLVFPEDFHVFGSPEAIRLALHRLEKGNQIKRVTHGIYVRPRISKYIGEVLPSAEEVAKGIAKRDRIRIVPTGVHALNALGLSTQVPMKLVFLTDGAPRIIKIGKHTLPLLIPKVVSLFWGSKNRKVVSVLKVESTPKSQKIKNATIPSTRDQISKLHKKLIFNEFILVRFCVFVFWWQQDCFRSGLKV